MARRRTPLAKTHRPYSIAQVDELYGCHRNTVRLWLKKGLEPVTLVKPFLIHGTALNAFHAARRKQRKRPCQPGKMYCFPCRKRQLPAGGMFDYLAVTPVTRRVTAICPHCGRLMNQRVNRTRLAAFEAQATTEAYRDNGN